MKIHFLLVIGMVASLTNGLSAQTRELDPKALDAIDARPTKIPPKFIPKGAGRAPATEASREYIFSPKGVKSKSARVISMSDGTKIEAPLVDIPLLFLVNSTELADIQSRDNLEILAEKLKSLPEGRFCIEGHASAEGDGSHNQKLSTERAYAIRGALQKLGVSSQVFSSMIGLGSRHANAPADAPEPDLARDRRVLLIREE